VNYKDLWNKDADHQNQWESLGEDEKLEFAAQCEREACAKVCESHVRHPSRLHFAAAIRARGNT
jgi:hypothetical protein